MIEWLLEFEGQQKLLGDIRSTELLKVLEPLRHTVAETLNNTDVESLDGLKVVFCSEGAGWSIRLEGPVQVVNEATSLLGKETSIVPPTH